MAKKSTAKKSLFYRRAKWDGQKTDTLEQLLVDAHIPLKTTGDRTFDNHSTGEIRGANVRSTANGLLFQIATYVPDEATSTIDKSKTVTASKITTEPAPTGKDYLDGDIFALVKGNNVILCPSGAREGTFTYYVWQVLRGAGKDTIAKSFELVKVSKTNKVAMIKKEGVKSIELDTSLYEASLINISKTKPKISSIKRAITDQIEAVFAKDTTLKDIHDKENLNIKLTINFDGKEARYHTKEPHFGDIGKERLQKTAERVINEFDGDDEGYAITTSNGNTIKLDEIRVSKKFTIELLGKSLARDSAWKQLESYHGELDKAGILKQ